MPEGDTVFQAARRLDEALSGDVLAGCDIRVPRYATVDLSGGTVEATVPRGKHLLTRIGDYSIHSHLKMEGRWDVYDTGQRWRRPAYLARIVLRTDRRQAVGFELGVLEVVARDDEDDVVGYLGPDLLGTEWDPARAIDNLRRAPEVPAFVAFLDQRNLAGLGNVYVNELLFLRGIAPTTPIADIDVPGTVALASRLILTNRDRVERIFTGDARPGRGTWVYGRSGRPCRRCGTTIVHGTLGRTELQQRDTFHCPHCQPARG